MAQIAEAANPVKPALDIAETAVKLALDRAELYDCIPELQREAAAINWADDGRLVLVLPRHPAVLAFIRELDAMEYETAADLKTARSRLRVARDNYQTRVAHRVMQTLDGPAFNRFVSLSAIFIALAAGKHWRKVIMKLEAAKKITEQQEQNRRHIAHHQAGRDLSAAFRKVLGVPHDHP